MVHWFGSWQLLLYFYVFSAKDKKEMMEMLKRVDEEGGGDLVGSEESDQSVDLEDRLSGLDLGVYTL